MYGEINISSINHLEMIKRLIFCMIFVLYFPNEMNFDSTYNLNSDESYGSVKMNPALSKSTFNLTNINSRIERSSNIH